MDRNRPTIKSPPYNSLGHLLSRTVYYRHPCRKYNQIRCNHFRGSKNVCICKHVFRTCKVLPVLQRHHIGGYVSVRYFGPFGLDRCRCDGFQWPRYPPPTCVPRSFLWLISQIHLLLWVTCIYSLWGEYIC